MIIPIRFFHLTKRLYAFLRKALVRDYFLYVKHIFYIKLPRETKKTQKSNKNKSLIDLKYYDIFIISKFLSPYEILQFSLVNKYISNSLFQKDLPWKYQLKNYYIPKMTINNLYMFSKSINSTYDNDVNFDFEINRILSIDDKHTLITTILQYLYVKNDEYLENYLVLNEYKPVIYKDICYKASIFINRTNNNQFGYLYITISETINMILSIPHLILLPIKLLSFIIILFSNKIYSLMIKYRNYLHDNYSDYIYDNTLFPLKDYFNNRILLFSSNQIFIYDFYSIQLHGLEDIVYLTIYLIIFIFFIVHNFIMFIFKLLCLVDIRRNKQYRTYDNRIKSLSLHSKAIQNIYSYFYCLLVIIFSLSPTLYFHYESIKYIYSSIGIYSYIKTKSLIWLLRTLLGKYFFNIILFKIIIKINKGLIFLFQNEDIIIFDLAYKLLMIEKNVFSFNFLKILKILFPQISLLGFIMNNSNINRNSVYINLYVLFVCIIFPVCILYFLYSMYEINLIYVILYVFMNFYYLYFI